MAEYRIPTLAEAEALAAYLKANGYQPADAAKNFRSAFPDGECNDGALMFEGDPEQIDRLPERWAGYDGEDGDDKRDADGSWLNGTLMCALLTLAAEAGEAYALDVRAEELAYMRANWS